MNLILDSKYGFDTKENAIKVKNDIKSFVDYKFVINETINCLNSTILKEILQDQNFNVYKNILQNEYNSDMFQSTKEFIINSILQTDNKDIIQLVCEDLYEEDLPINSKCDNLIYQNKQIIDKTKDIEYIIENFEEITGLPMLNEKKCITKLEEYLKRPLEEYEENYLINATKNTEMRVYKMKQEMSSMSESEYDAWVSWMKNNNYNSYEHYHIVDKINVWNRFLSNC